LWAGLRAVLEPPSEAMAAEGEGSNEGKERTMNKIATQQETQFEPEPKQWWKVRPVEGGDWLYVPNFATLDDMLEGGADDGHKYELESVWMTQKEIDALPEWGGW
jgi:hypothetical protein